MLHREASIPSCVCGSASNYFNKLKKKNFMACTSFMSKQIVQLGKEVIVYWLTLVELVFNDRDNESH